MKGVDELDLKILDHCRSPRTVKEITTAYPERDLSNIHRRVHRLLDEGLLAKTEEDRKLGVRFQTTEAGLRLLAQGTLQARLDAMADVYPPLRFLPTPVHRALCELVLFAVAARKCQERHLPFFLAIGPPLTWKSTVGEFLCHAVGVDPTRHVIQLSAERGQSLFTRRGGTGVVVSKREILDSPYVFLDEYGLAEEAVRRTIVGVYMRGVKRVPFENQELLVQPVPLIAVNPRRGQTLEERTGLTSAEIRRGVVCDLGAVPLPESTRTQGEEVLRRTHVHGPIRPGAQPQDCAAHRQEVSDILAANTVSPQLTDLDLLMGLIEGATAYLPPPLAAQVVLHDYFTVVETAGLARPGWHASLLAKANGQNTPKEAEPAPKCPDPEAEFEPLVRESRLVEVEEALQGADPTAALGLVRLSARWFRQHGPDARGLLAYLDASTSLFESKKQLEGQVARLQKSKAAASAELQVLRTEIQSLGTTPDRVRDLHHLDQQMQGVGLIPDRAVEFVKVYRQLRARGYTLASLQNLQTALRGRRLGVEDVVHLAWRGKNLQDGIVYLEQESQKWKWHLHWLRWEHQNLGQVLCDWQQKVQYLEAQFQALLREVSELAGLQYMAQSVADARRRVEEEREWTRRTLTQIREGLGACFEDVRTLVKFREVPVRCPQCGRTRRVSIKEFVESFRLPEDEPPKLPAGQP